MSSFNMSSLYQSGKLLSNSSRYSRESSSRASYDISRNAGKVAVDLLAVSEGKEFKEKPGQHYNRLHDLGEEKYNELMQDGKLILETIYFCQKALEEVTKESMKNWSVESAASEGEVEIINKIASKGIVNHDYHVLALKPGKDERLHILAHKVGNGVKGEVGIIIEPIEEKVLSCILNENVISQAITCDVHIPLDSLIKTLMEEDPAYHLRDKNCWDYARNTAERLLSKCAAVVGISRTKKDMFLKEKEGWRGKSVQQTIADKIAMLSNAKIEMSSCK